MHRKGVLSGGIYPFLSQLGNKKRSWLPPFVFSSFTQILRWCYIWTVPFVPWVNFIHILSPIYVLLRKRGMTNTHLIDNLNTKPRLIAIIFHGFPISLSRQYYRYYRPPGSGLSLPFSLPQWKKLFWSKYRAKVIYMQFFFFFNEVSAACL